MLRPVEGAHLMRFPRTPFALMIAGAFSLVACGGSEPGGGATSSAPTAPKTEAAAPAAAPAAAGTASISGKISFEGTVPPADKVKLNADPKCAAMHKEGLDRAVIHAKDGGPAPPPVSVKSPVKATSPTPTEPILPDQKASHYSPHTVEIPAAHPPKIRNSDDTLHNIHPRP